MEKEKKVLHTPVHDSAFLHPWFVRYSFVHCHHNCMYTRPRFPSPSFHNVALHRPFMNISSQALPLERLRDGRDQPQGHLFDCFDTTGLHVSTNPFHNQVGRKDEAENH